VKCDSVEKWRSYRLFNIPPTDFSALKCSSWICYLIFKHRLPGGKGRLNFVEEKATVDCTYCVGHLLPNLVKNCNRLLPTGFIFQQDGAPTHTVRRAGCGPTVLSRFHHKGPVASKFTVSKPVMLTRPHMSRRRPQPPRPRPRPNITDLNRMDYHVTGAMLEAYRKLKTKPKTMAELIRKRFRLSGATCHRDRSTRLWVWKTSQSDWRLVLELVVDTSNIHSDNTEFWHLIIS